MAREIRSDAQRVLDIMFPVLSMVHAGDAPRDREDCMEWARNSLRNSGFDVTPMGMCHAVIKEPVLCHENEDWDWWLKLPPAHKAAMVKHYRAMFKELS